MLRVLARWADDLGVAAVSAGEPLTARAVPDLVGRAAQQARGGGPVHRRVDALKNSVHVYEYIRP